MWENPSTGQKITKRIHTLRDEIYKAIDQLAEPCRVALEATRHAPCVCRWLQEAGAEVHLSDPQALHAVGKLRRAKTDEKDAELLWHALTNGYLPEAYLAPDTVVDARELSRGRRTLRKMATRLMNSIRALFAKAGVQCNVSDLRGKAASEQRQAWMSELSFVAGIIVNVFWTLLDVVEMAIAQLEEHIDEWVQNSPLAQKLQGFAGFGPVNTLAMLAEIGDIERFPEPKNLHSYAGVVPNTNKSDGYEGRGELPSRCNKKLRYWAILAAQSAARSSQPSKAKEVYQRQKLRNGANTAKIAAAREILNDIYYTYYRMLAAASDPPG